MCVGAYFNRNLKGRALSSERGGVVYEMEVKACVKKKEDGVRLVVGQDVVIE
jgi:hypothetical protein